MIRLRPLRRSPTGSLRPLLALALAVGLGACATRPDPADPDAVAEFRTNNDPLEPLNRGSYAVHDAIDTAVLRPAAVAYRFVLPQDVRTAIRNVLANLRAPVIFANDLLQGDRQRAAATINRFVVNTTVGIGGIFDRAAEWGLLGHTEDFGQTLAVWGLAEGPYLFIPVFGPSNPRDVGGFVADTLINPLTYVGDGLTTITITRTVLGALDAREGLIETVDALKNSSVDPYSTIRSAYRQRRAAEIRNQSRGPEASPDLGLGSGLGSGLRR